MADMIWCWKRGESTIYTKRYDLAQQAIRSGHFVSIVKDKPHIFRN